MVSQKRFFDSPLPPNFIRYFKSEISSSNEKPNLLSWLRDVPQPHPRVARCASVGQCAAEVGHRLEIVDRAEVVDVGKDLLDAPGLGLEAFVAQQRIEPDQSAT